MENRRAKILKILKIIQIEIQELVVLFFHKILKHELKSNNRYLNFILHFYYEKFMFKHEII